jgi:hypothetical protein
MWCSTRVITTQHNVVLLVKTKSTTLCWVVITLVEHHMMLGSADPEHHLMLGGGDPEPYMVLVGGDPEPYCTWFQPSITLHDAGDY